jgi:sec-independent protein translocase protein TatA
MNFGNLGFMEILLILVVVLLLFGARRLPEIGASFGKSIKEFKRGLSDANSAIRDEYRQTLPPNPAEPVGQEEEARPEPKRLIT